MLNKRHVLAKLRTELEGREERLCRQCGRFGHLAQKYRSGKEEEKKITVGNRFKVLKNWMMQCGVKEVRRQKVAEQTIKCFLCREEGHKKQKCPKENKRKREKVALL